MTSELFVNFHQSERMYHIPNALEWKNRSLNSSRRSKRLFLQRSTMEFGESLVFQMAPLVHAKITRLRCICSESSNNWDILSSEPVSLMEAQTNRFLRKFGTSAGLIREDKAPDLKIEKGECSVVLSSPESFSRNRRVGGEGFPEKPLKHCV